MRYPELFKLGFQAELDSQPLPNNQTDRKRSSGWLKPLLGAGAVGGLAYMGDRYLNGGAGLNAIKQQFAGGTGSTNSKPVQPTNIAGPIADQIVTRGQQAMAETAPEAGGRVGMGAVGAGQALANTGNIVKALKQPTVVPELLQSPKAVAALKWLQASKANNFQPVASALKVGLQPVSGLTSAARAAAQPPPLPGASTWLNNPVTRGIGTGLKRALPVLGAAGGAMDADIAERGMFNVNLGETTNRTLGGAAGLATTLHPAGILGNLGIAGYTGVKDYQLGAQAKQDQTAGDAGDYLQQLYRAMKDPASKAEATTQLNDFLAEPRMAAMLSRPDLATNYPATASLLGRIRQQQ